MARGKDKEKKNQEKPSQKVEISGGKQNLRDVWVRASGRLSERADLLGRRSQSSLQNTQSRLSRDTTRFERVRAAHDQLNPPPAVAGKNSEIAPAPPELPADLLHDLLEKPPTAPAKPKPQPSTSRELTASSLNPPPLPTDFELPESLTDMGLAPRSKAANRFATPSGRRMGKTVLPSIAQPNSKEFSVEGNPSAPYLSFLMPNNVGDQIKDQVSSKINLNKTGGHPFGENFPNLTVGEVTQLPPRTEPEIPAQNVPPEELVAEPVYNPNLTRGRRPGTSRQMFKFENPRFALLAGIASFGLLVGLVFFLFFVNSNITRTSDDRFVILFATAGEGANYAPIANGGGTLLAQTLRDNFIQNTTLGRLEIRTTGSTAPDVKQARTLARSSGADMVISSYRNTKNNQLVSLILLNPNGPYDLPLGTGHEIAERYLFEPDQLTFVAPLNTLEQSTGSDLTKYMRAIASYYLGNYDVAERDFKELIAKNIPENEAGLRIFYANTLFLMGNYQGALTNYNALVNLNQVALSRNQTFPLNPAIVQNNRAVALYNINNYAEANKAFEAALSIRTDLPKIYANYAAFLIEKTDLEYRPQLVDEWKKRMTESLKIDKNIPLVYYNLGRLQNFQGDYDGAIASFEQARKLDPDYLEAYWEQGQTWFAKFDKDNDYDYVNKALDVLKAGESRGTNLAKLNRERSQKFSQEGNQILSDIWFKWASLSENYLNKIRLGVTRVYVEQTRVKGKDKGNPFDQLGRWVKSEKTPYEEAGPRLKDALAANPEDPETNFLNGQFLAITGEGDPLPFYQKAKTNEKNSNKRFRYHQVLAEQYKAAGKLQEALNEYTEYVKFDPNRVQGYTALADAQYDLKQYKEAAASADKALKLNPNDYTAYTVGAKALIADQQYQQALSYLEKALLIKPDYALGYYQQGLAYYNLNRRNDALVSFNKAIDLKLEAADAYYYSGVIYADTLKNPAQALPRWEKAVALKPDYAEAWARLATAYIQQNDSNRAIDACERAINAGVKEGPIYYYQGVLLEARNANGDLAKAEQRYKQAIEITPGLVNAHIRLAEVILNQDNKRADQALASVQKALQLEPRSAEANVALGNVLRAKADYDGAINSYNTAISLKKDIPEAFYGRSIALVGKAQYQQALTDIDQALNLRKNWSDAYLIKGIVHLNLKQYPQAQNSLEQVRKLNPSDFRAYIQLGNLYEAQNQIDQAISTYEQGVGINAKDVRFYARLGRLYLVKKDVDRALDTLKKGQQLDPTLGTEQLGYNLGRAYMLKNRYTEALPPLEAQVKLSPTFIEARYELGNVYKTLGQNDAAITQYTEAVKLQPAFSQAWLELGRLYQSANNIPKAREAYQNAVKSNDPQVRDLAQTALNNLGK